VNKIVSRCTFIVAVGVWVVLSITAPWVLGDANTFLKNFVNHELLGVLGVIVTITLASAANLHLQLNRIEDEFKKTFLTSTRRAVKQSAFSMIVIFAIAVVDVVVKPLLPSGDMSASFANGIALLVILFAILVLIDLTQLVFKIEPIHKMLPNDEEKRKENGKP
jgi:hypothetical protein